MRRRRARINRRVVLSEGALALAPGDRASRGSIVESLGCVVDDALTEIERLPGRHLYFLDDHLVVRP